MTVSRTDVVRAEARMLAQDRARWPGAPLIGAGTDWLRAGTIANMAEMLAESDADITAIRQAVRPMGCLDALEIFDQFSMYVAERASDLRRLGQVDAAMALEAEAADPADAAWHKAKGQFSATIEARVKAERPPVPVWIDNGNAWTAVSVAARFGSDPDALAELGAFALDLRIDEIEAAMKENTARLRWLQAFDYPISAPGTYDSNRAGGGLIIAASNASVALAKVHGEAITVFARSNLESWNLETVSRRMMEKIAMQRPTLAAEMMGRSPPVTVLENGGLA